MPEYYCHLKQAPSTWKSAPEGWSMCSNSWLWPPLRIREKGRGGVAGVSHLPPSIHSLNTPPASEKPGPGIILIVKILSGYIHPSRTTIRVFLIALLRAYRRATKERRMYALVRRHSASVNRVWAFVGDIQAIWCLTLKRPLNSVLLPRHRGDASVDIPRRCACKRGNWPWDKAWCEPCSAAWAPEPRQGSFIVAIWMCIA